MPSGVVFWTGSGRDAVVVVWQSERMKEFHGGRRPTKGRSGIKGEMNRQIIQESQQWMQTEHSIGSVGKERMILLFNYSNLTRRLPFCGQIIQFWATNWEQSNSTLALRNREIEEHRQFQGSWQKIKEIRQEQHNLTRREQHFLAPHFFSHQEKFFVSSSHVLLSSLTVSLLIQTGNFVRVEIFLIWAKDFFSE